MLKIIDIKENTSVNMLKIIIKIKYFLINIKKINFFK